MYTLLYFVVVQNVIASHESNGLDIIIALLSSDINPLRKHRIDLVLQLKVSDWIQFVGKFSDCQCPFEASAENNLAM